MRHRSRIRPTGLAVMALGAVILAAPPAAAAPPGHRGPAAPGGSRSPGLIGPVRRAGLPAGQRYACPAPARPGQMACQSIIRIRAGAVPAAAAGAVAGYSPASLRGAYRLAAAAARNGRGRTVAVVDAYSDPRAAADLAAYRAHFRLGPCTTASRCLRIVNQFGNPRRLPAADRGWAAEESLDLDMVSAICPRCRILLVEARSASIADLGTAEDTAIAMGARYVSNSWSGPEFTGQDAFDRYFNHPGVAISVASGDFGYGTAYPADLQYVTSVGGTSLHRSRNRRGWSEQAWGSPGADGTGSGCSPLEAKPSWQRADATFTDPAKGCVNRTENDVSAVANPYTGVAVYDSYPPQGLRKGWNELGGTSAATPIITAVYALAGVPRRATYPAEYPYLRPGHLFDITSGANGTCPAAQRYLCHAVRGYDGPTGLGTPDGTAAFTAGTAPRVTLLDPGTLDRPAGGAFSQRIIGLDTRGARIPLRYAAAGLPAGLSIAALPRSNDALITGTLPAQPGTYHVTVIARDGTATGLTHFAIVVVASLAATAQPGPVKIIGGTLCLDGGAGTAGTPVTVQPCAATPGQGWAYRATGGPDQTGTLTVGGECLGLSGTKGVLGPCAGSAGQRWRYLGLGLLGNLAAGRCLVAPALTAGTQVVVKACDGSSFQRWTLPPGPVVSGAGAVPAALCLAGQPTPATRVTVAACGPSAQQQWSVTAHATIGLADGLCLSGNGSVGGGTPVAASACSTEQPDQLWVPGPEGELVNVLSGQCLTDPADGAAGTGLVEQYCHGAAGQVWGIN